MKNILNYIECEEEHKSELNHFFKDNNILLQRLIELDEKKKEIRKMKSLYGDLEKPLVITISGTPRAGKTTCIDNLFEFLKKTDLRTSCLEEPAGMVYSTLKNSEEKKELLKDRIGFVEKQYQIGKDHINKALGSNDIILCDRGILDTFIWYNMYYKLGMMNKERYDAFLTRISDTYEYKNIFYTLYTDSENSLLRDYMNSISIEPRTTMNRSNIERYNDSMLELMPTFKEYTDSELIDTTNLEKIDASIIIANKLLDVIDKQYTKKRKENI